MTTERSDRVFENWRQSSEKFDYFTLGATGALCTYITNTHLFMKIGLTPNTLEFVALLLFCMTAVAGFIRIESIIGGQKANYALILFGEMQGTMTENMGKGTGVFTSTETGEIITPEQIQTRLTALSQAKPKAKGQIEIRNRSAVRWYRCRNWSLAAGFIALISAKVWGAYL